MKSQTIVLFEIVFQKNHGGRIRIRNYYYFGGDTISSSS